MRVESLPRPVSLSCAVSLIAGVVMLIPSPAAEAIPPLCDGKPATIVGTSGNDVLKGTDSDDVIVGLGGDDRLVGGDGNDTLCGKDGNDTLVGGPGDDVLLGGNGSDWVAYGLAPSKVEVDLLAGIGTGWGTDELGSIENVIGSRYDDRLVGDASPNMLLGGDGRDVLIGVAGPDVLRGGGGNDTLRGSSGADQLEGGSGRDTLSGNTGNDHLDGGDGNDLVLGGRGNDYLTPGAGNDIVRGGSGDDQISYQRAPGGTTVNLRDGVAIGWGTDTIASVDHVIGSEFDDVIIGNGSTNRLFGGEGDDQLRGRAGDDTLLGNDDSDLLIGGAGNDHLYGFSPAECCWAPDEFPDILRGGPGDDVLHGAVGPDSLYGNSGDDDLYGDDANDHLFGGDGQDLIDGGYGDDHLDGGSGVDLLDGWYDFDECIRGEIYRSCELITNRWLTFDASDWVGRTVSRATSDIDGFDHVVVDGQPREDLVAQEGGAIAPWDHEYSTGAYAWFVSMVPDDAVEPPDFGRTLVWLVEEPDQGVVLDALGLTLSPGKEIEYCWQARRGGRSWPLVLWVGPYGWAASPPPEYFSAFDLPQLECSAG